MKAQGYIQVALLVACAFLFLNCGGPLPDIQADLNSSALHPVEVESEHCADGSTAVGACQSAVVANSKIALTIATNTTNYNIASAAGSPTTPVDIEVTVNSGVTVKASSVAVAAMSTGQLPSGSTLTIVNNGKIVGAGGEGGSGGEAYPGSPIQPLRIRTVPGPGGAGGPALSISLPVIITNNGVIGGGGGGGGGGAPCVHARIGSGGGGGAGGGAGGKGAALGKSGTDSAPGDGGRTVTCSKGGKVGSGGSGGGFGQPGMPADAGGAGGLAGAAIVRNGFSVNFKSGGSAPNLLGTL